MEPGRSPEPEQKHPFRSAAFVDVLQAYSRQGRHKVDKLSTVRNAISRLEGVKTQQERTPNRHHSRRYRITDRFTPDELAAVAARYQAGEYSTNLAKEYGIAKSTLLKLLGEQGIEVRTRGLTPAKQREILRLRKQGLIIRAIAKRVGCSYDTARKFLLSAAND